MERFREGERVGVREIAVNSRASRTNAKTNADAGANEKGQVFRNANKGVRTFRVVFFVQA